VSSVIPVLLLALAGFLLGGAYSLHSQGKPVRYVLVLVGLGVLAVIAGVLYI